MRVVLVRLSALGDIIHAWPLAEALRDARPDMHLTWVVEEPLQAMVAGHPAVDSVFTAATKRWRRQPLAARTRAEIARLRTRFHELQPDLAIDPQGVLKSAVITRWTTAPRRVGLARPWRRERLAGLAYTSTVPGSARHRHVVASNMELVRSIGGVPPINLPRPDGRWLLRRASELPSPAPWDSRPIVLLPGAGQTKKMLPVATLSEVARRLAALPSAVVIAWGPGERSRAETVASGAGSGVHLAPPTNLDQLVTLLAGALLVIGGDTGPVHLAASLGVPTLGVYTVTDWQRNGPLGPRVSVASGISDGSTGTASSPRATPSRAVTAHQIVALARELLG
jgi:heptosyltransferase-1